MFNKNEHTQVPLLDRSAPFMNDIAVSKGGVIKLLKGLNPSKALGPDELHPRVLKELATQLGPIFAHLFQQSTDTGEIPKEWSLANICPLFKKSDRSFACNYRPVSFTCVPCKLLEHIAVARSEASSLGMQAAPSSIPTSGTFFRRDSVMKTFLRPFSLFR